MSRPIRPYFAVCAAALSLVLFGCRTVYSPMYSNDKTYYVSPEARKRQEGTTLSAAEIMRRADAADEAAAKAAASGAGAGGVPADPNAMPGVPPAAPDASAIPGLTTPPPAAPPAAPPAQ